MISLAGAWLEGLQHQGVMAVGKHFPGHGAARADSHKSLPILSKNRAALEAWELQPFKALMARLPAVMTAHLVAHGLGDDKPATWSSVVLQDLLRQAWDYPGLIVSDALEMGALSGTMAARADQSIQAGCDLVLCCTGCLEDTMAALEGITRAMESLTPAQRRKRRARIQQALTPYTFPPGDWRTLLKQPDYLNARRLVEAITEEIRAEDPTDSSAPPAHPPEPRFPNVEKGS